MEGREGGEEGLKEEEAMVQLGAWEEGEGTAVPVLALNQRERGGAAHHAEGGRQHKEQLASQGRGLMRAEGAARRRP